MKNRLIKTVIIFVISLFINQLTYGEEFTFEISNIEITKNGNLYRGLNRGNITTNNQIQIISDEFVYLKEKNILETNGDVVLNDIKNNLTINAEQIFYLKDDEKIYTLGKTTVNVSDKYKIEGTDLIFIKDKMLLYSKKDSTIKDNFSNIYKLGEFQYLIDQEILKGEKIEIIKNYNKENSDVFFLENAFLDLKEKTFLGKDINAKLHKKMFGNNENDPRISATSVYSDELNTYFEKGVFTSCKKTEKCPPWKIRSKKIKHDKIKKQITYDNAWLDIYDIPIIYFPKFFHPDSTVERQSGFLRPALSSSQNLGTSTYTPYFYVISDNKDITIKPKLFNNNTFILQNEYRQKTKKTHTIADFSLNNKYKSKFDNEEKTRSHFFINSKINLDLQEFSYSILEINYQKTSNDNYLKLSDLDTPLITNNKDFLESNIQLELENQNYTLMASVEMYETLKGHKSDRYEYVLPSYDFYKSINLEDISGNIDFNSTGNNRLINTNSVETLISNDLKYSSNNFLFNNGIENNFIIALKNINTKGKKSSLYKSNLQSEISSMYIYNASLPFIKDTKKSLNKLEPRLSFRFNPHDMKSNTNLDRRIDINNIFNTNRLSFEDTFESGESLTVGLNYNKQKKSKENDIDKISDYIEFKLATVFRNKLEKNIPKKSTLNKKKSNIFGQLNFKPSNVVSFDYDFSITDDMKFLEYSSLNTKIDYKNISTEFNFLEEHGYIGDTNIIENISKFNFNEDNSLSFKTRRNNTINLTEYYDLLYEYKNDCLIAGIKYKKNYYSDSDLKPEEELLFTLSIVPFSSSSD